MIVTELCHILCILYFFRFGLKNENEMYGIKIVINKNISRKSVTYV